MTPLATDPTNHMAIAFQPASADDCGEQTLGPIQIASFTANSKGTLTTTNTYKNMPALAGGIGNMTITPSGKVLAVATGTGTQFFHFNGASPITEFTGIIGSSGYITAMQWDKSNHLYAINGATGKVHVYTVTTTSVVEAPGSPYPIGAEGIVVAVP